MSLIEGYRFGLPAICFSDIDAAYDIYDDKCTVLIKERTDEAVSYAIQRLLAGIGTVITSENFRLNFHLI